MNTASIKIKVTLEIPDALDPVVADAKYTEPLREALLDVGGLITAVAQGEPSTPDEFSRLITIELTRYSPGLEIIQRFLAENDAPPGTMITVYDSNGQSHETFMLGE